MHDVAVAAFADAKVAAPMKRAPARLDLAGAEVAAGDVLDGGDGGLLHAQVDPLADPIAVAREKGAHGRDGGVIGGRMIRLQTPRADRGATRPAVDVEHPAKRREHGVIGGEVAVGAGLTERRDRQQDQRGIGGVQRLPSEAHRVHRAGRKALDNQVGAARELPQQDRRRADASSRA